MQPSRAIRRHLLRFASVVTVLALGSTMAGCSASGTEDQLPDGVLRMMIPNSAGGGYDLTGRAAAKALQDSELTERVEITNVLGASGTVAMHRLLNEEGTANLVLMMGLGVVGAASTQGSDAAPAQMTPIARLVEEPEAILVPADSPFTTVDDLVAAWRDSPGAVSVGGGSTLGGPDHLFPLQLAAEVGVEPASVRFTSYDGGGPLTTALLGAEIDVAFSGLGEFMGHIAEGSLRILAVSGRERRTGVDAPTLTESGIDLVFSNWRGVLAPPGLSDDQRDHLVDLFTQMQTTPQWRDALERNGWTPSFATGEDFAAFLREQDARVATTLAELGLT